MKNLDESFGVCAQSGQINTVKISETKSWTFCMSLTCLWVFMLVYKELWHKVSLFQVIVVQLLSSTDSLWPHGLQHARPLCPPLSLGVCSNSCPLSQWCYLTISSCHPLFLLPSIFSSIRDCKEIKPVNVKGNQPWIFIERTDAEIEAPDSKSQPIGKDPESWKGKS